MAESTPAAPSCDFPGKPGEAGHVHACQLCPRSPTYWRGKAAEGSTDTQRSCRWTSPAGAAATS